MVSNITISPAISNIIPLVRFAGGGTITAPPPTKPPVPGALGGYCIKAVCGLRDKHGTTVGKVTGWDTSGTIEQRVANVCQFRRSKAKGETCGEVQLTLLPHRPDLICTGQITFSFDGQATKFF